MVSIYNRQKQTSASGKEYIGYVVAFAPGQRGAIPAAAEVPPFYIRDQRGGRQWIRLEARTLQDAKSEAIQQQHVLQAVSKGVHVIPTSDGRARLADKVAEYLLEIEANRSRKSWLVYKNTLENFFLNSCRKLYVDEVSRQDILSFKGFLRSKCPSDRSTYNHFPKHDDLFEMDRAQGGHQQGRLAGQIGASSRSVHKRATRKAVSSS